MAGGRDDARTRSNRGQQAGKARAVATAPQPRGAFRWIVMILLTVSTLALLAVAGLLGLVVQQWRASDVAALKQDIAGVRTETASFHAEVAKSLAALQKAFPTPPAR